jgi:hypothetical protein
MYMLWQEHAIVARLASGYVSISGYSVDNYIIGDRHSPLIRTKGLRWGDFVRNREGCGGSTGRYAVFRGEWLYQW